MSGRYLLLASRFNDLITKALLAGAQETLAEAGVQDVDTLWVPGRTRPLVYQSVIPCR